jgi:DNA-directed RNA polymerase subunit E'/Rpb7
MEEIKNDNNLEKDISKMKFKEKKQMEESIYNKELLDTKIILHPNDLGKNINDKLEKKLKEKIEGHCIREGYIRVGSTNIISRTEGHLNINIFDGNISYHVKFTADICNPKRDQLIICYVLDNNKSAVSTYIEDPDTSPLEIFLPRQHHIGNIEFAKLEKGDKIIVKVIDSKYEYMSRHINVIASFEKKL